MPVDAKLSRELIANDQSHETVLLQVSPDHDLQLKPPTMSAAVYAARAKRIPAFAERVLPRAADLWVQASLHQRQRLQRLFFPEGIAFDGNRFNRAASTAPFFKYLAPNESAEESLVNREGIEPWRKVTAAASQKVTPFKSEPGIGCTTTERRANLEARPFALLDISRAAPRPNRVRASLLPRKDGTRRVRVAVRAIEADAWRPCRRRPGRARRPPS